MANGYGHPGPPPERGNPDQWSPPHRMQRPDRPDDTWPPDWGPLGDEGQQRAQYSQRQGETTGQRRYPNPPPPRMTSPIPRPTHQYPPPAYPPQDYPQQDYPQQGYPDQGYQDQGYPGQDYPSREYPPQSYPSQGYPPQSYPSQDYSQQGYSQQGYSSDYPPAPYPPARRAPMDDMLQTRPTYPDAESPAPRRRAGRFFLSMVIAVVLLVGVGLGAIYLTGRHGNTPSASTSRPVALPPGDPIISQQADPKPLTTKEVFGKGTISGGSGTYTVVKSQALTDCSTIATDKIATMLSDDGCTQAVRATLRSSDGTYLVTAGIANLPDSTKAAAARTSVASFVTANTGHFIGLTANGGVTLVTTHLGWDARGHYLFYAVISLANGKPISGSDSQTDSIINDVVEDYLSGTVIGAREPDKSPSPGHSH